MALGALGILQNTTPISKSLSQHRDSEQLREMGINKERTLASGQRKDTENQKLNVLYG